LFIPIFHVITLHYDVCCVITNRGMDISMGSYKCYMGLLGSESEQGITYNTAYVHNNLQIRKWHTHFKQDAITASCSTLQ
jgi:hypothetical protein